MSGFVNEGLMKDVRRVLRVLFPNQLKRFFSAFIGEVAAEGAGDAGKRSADPPLAARAAGGLDPTSLKLRWARFGQ